jgi:hypothetical protein
MVNKNNPDIFTDISPDHAGNAISPTSSPRRIKLNIMSNETLKSNDLLTAANQISKKLYRTKFNTISERESINTDGIINTDETITIEPDEFGTDDNYGTHEPDDHDSGDDREITRTAHNVHEFSISTLDRKLKELKKIKKCNNRNTIKSRIQSFEFSGGGRGVYTPTAPQMNKSNHFSPKQHSPKQHSPKQHSPKHATPDRMNKVTIMMNPSKLINDHMREIQLRIIGHTRAAISYEKKEKIIGYPVTILSSFLTSAIMMSITDGSPSDRDAIKFISLTLSITSFLFSVSRDYLNFARKFQSHDLSSKLYTTLLRSIEVRLINTHLSNDERRDIFKDIVDQMSIIEQYETPVPTGIDSDVRKNHAEIMDYADE